MLRIRRKTHARDQDRHGGGAPGAARAEREITQSLNETREEKLPRTHMIQQERTQALGIAVDRNLVGGHTPTKVCGRGWFSSHIKLFVPVL